jgi:hypothetical protein
MKYLLLIQHGDMPKPGSPEWEALSKDEQKAVGADYQAVDQTEGVTQSRSARSRRATGDPHVEGAHRREG